MCKKRLERKASKPTFIWFIQSLGPGEGKSLAAPGRGSRGWGARTCVRRCEKNGGGGGVWGTVLLSKAAGEGRNVEAASILGGHHQPNVLTGRGAPIN